MESVDERVSKEIDSLLGDWLDRGSTYVKTRKSGRIGWESSLEEGSSYSAYYLEAPSTRELIRRAYPLARDMLVAMNPPCKFNVQISPGKIGGCTDGKTVFVKTGVFDDSELEPSEMLDIFLGVVVHEGCHLLYTDMSLLSDTRLDSLSKQIFNILEDERIETICGDRKPGFSRFIEKVKYYLFDKLFIEDTALTLEEKPLFERFMISFLQVVRYPRYVNKDAVGEFLYQFSEIKDLLLPFPTDGKTTLECSLMIADIIRDLYIEEEKKRDEEKSKGGKEGDGEGSSDGDSSVDTEATRTSRAFKRLEEDAKKFSKTLDKLSSSPSEEGLSKEDTSEEVLKDGGLLGELCEGRIEVGDHDSYFKKAPAAKGPYLSSLGKVSRYIPSVSRVIKGHCKEYRLIHRSMRSGILDTNKLAEAIQGVPTVYLREGQVFTDKVAVCVLIDESGSMCGGSISGGSKMDAAKDAAVLLNEAVSSLPAIELFIYGHSGDMRYSGATELNVYKEPGYSPKYALGSAVARSQNRDGIAILETAKRVRKFTKNPALFFVISDGAPAADSYDGMRAIQHTKDAVLQVERMDFSVVQVCIDSCYDPKLMFKHYVILTDLARLSIDLGKVIKNAIVKKAKVHTL